MTPSQESDIYRQLMRFKPEDLSANAWAVRAGVSRTVWADMRRHGNPSRRTLEKLLGAVGSSLAEFEALRILPSGGPEGGGSSATVGDGRRPWVAAAPKPLPLFAAEVSGKAEETGDGVERIRIRRDRIVEYVARPMSLAADDEAYALALAGDGMWPRFGAGSRVAVSPRSPVSIGDDILLELRASDHARAMVVRLVERTAGAFTVRQFNPDVTLTLHADQVAAIHRVAGELI